MKLSECVETLNLLGDENRIRLCMLLRERQLCVTDLVWVTGIAQSRVSTHLGRLREAGFVRDRRQGAQTFYTLSTDALPVAAKTVFADAAASDDPTLKGDQKRLATLERERRGGLPEAFAGEMERHYSPGRTWHSLALGFSALLDLGDVLDAGSGDGAAAATIAPHCRTLACIDANARMIEAAKERLSPWPNATAEVADVHALPHKNASFDSVLLFHTLTYAEHPEKALEECARVLRPGGRIVVLTLDHREHVEVTAPYGERHAGFSPRSLRGLITRAGLEIASCDIACREAKKPHFQVVLAVAHKTKLARASSRSASH